MDRQANVEQTDGHGASLEQVEQRFRRWRESRKQGQAHSGRLMGGCGGPGQAAWRAPGGARAAPRLPRATTTQPIHPS